ncbi:hypothetical protein MRX96_041428 [Rhipicephalus microplus]
MLVDTIGLCYFRCNASFVLSRDPNLVFYMSDEDGTRCNIYNPTEQRIGSSTENMVYDKIRTSLTLRTYTNEPVKHCGVAFVAVQYSAQRQQFPLYVLNQDGQPLLGRSWLQHLKLDWTQIQGLHHMQENDSAYFALWNDGKVKSEKTLRDFITYINKYTQLWNTDFVTLLTGRRMTKDKDPKQGVEGIKWGRGVCGSFTGALVSDTGDTNRTVLTFTHELSHALGANHDGEKTAKSCTDVGRSIMNRNFRGIGTSYSFCSMKDINTFLKKDQAKCVFDELPRAPAVDPEVQKRRKKECDKLKEENEYYYVRQGGNFCKYSCLFVNSTTDAATREIWLKEKNGTLCNPSNPKQKCKDGVCKQDETPISEDEVEFWVF